MTSRNSITGLATILMCLCAAKLQAQTDADSLHACIEKGFSDLVDSNSQRLRSAQYNLICDISEIDAEGNQCRQDQKAKEFTFLAPDGFVIGKASIKPIMKSPDATIVDVQLASRSAGIYLTCLGRPCEI